MSEQTPMRFAEKGKPYYDDEGVQRCGARTRGGYPCRSYPVTGRNRCDKHGGLTPVGMDAPSFRHGKHSKYLPKRLGEAYARAVNNPDILAMHEEAALLDTRLLDVLKRADAGEAGRLWLELRKSWNAFKAARAAGDVPGMQTAIETIDRITARGAGEAAAWQEVGDLIERRRKVVETETKRRVQMQTMITAEKLDLLLSVVARTVNEEVSDPTARRRIAATISSFIAGSEGAP